MWNLAAGPLLAVRQNFSSRISQLEKESLFNKYKEKEGDIVSGEVYQIWKKEILVMDDEGNELIMPRSEQIPSDFFKKGDTIRAVVSKVEMTGTTPPYYSYPYFSCIPRAFV